MRKPAIAVLGKRSILLILLTLCLLQLATAQVAPVDITVQLVPPYTSRIVDYVAPGNEKLRLIALQRDLTQASYRFFLRMEVSVNGQVLFRTSRNWQPPYTSISPGTPVILGGADLQPYFDVNHLDFVNFNRDQYIANPNLPEGYMSVCFTAYDYGRPDVAVSNTNCGNFFLTLPDPPLLNYPACGMQVKALTPQQMLFSWVPMSMGNATSANTVYELSLYENRDHRNPNDIVVNVAPVYTNRSQSTTIVYGPAEPALQTGLSYVWRVQAIDQTGQQAFKNNGYSQPCEFSYTADSGYNWANAQPLNIYALAMNESHAKIGWQSDAAVNYDKYTLYYRKQGDTNSWFNNTLTDTVYFLSDLEENTKYETRVQGIKGSSAGMYSNVASFTTPKKKVVQCQDAASILATYNGRPYLRAMHNDIVHYGDFEITLDNVQPTGEAGYYKGTGSVTIPFMAGMVLTVSFKNIQIDDELQVTAGDVVFDSQGVEAWVASTKTVNTVVKNLTDAIKALTASSIKDDAAALTQLEEAVKALAQQELPQVLMDSLNEAINQMQDGKIAYDEALLAYNNATTDEAKQEAQAKMDAAAQQFSDAQKAVEALVKEKDALVSAVAGVIVTAVKNIATENESNLAEIDKYRQDRKAAIANLYTSQGLDTTVNASTVNVDDMSIFIEDKTLDDDDRKAFIQQSNDMMDRLKKVKGLVVYKAFTSFFADQKTVTDSLLSDRHIAAKTLVDQLIAKKQSGETQANMVQYAHDYLVDELKKYIDSLTK